MVGHTCSYSSPAQCCISNSNCISTSMNTRVTDRAMANSRRAFSTVGNGISQGKRGSGKKLSKEEEELLALPVEEIARRIDTTLTPQQKEYVEALKKKYKGGNPNKRCE